MEQVQMNEQKKELMDLLEGYPDFMKSSDIVEIGLFPSAVSVYRSASSVGGLPGLRLNKRTLRFSKIAVVEWMLAKMLDLRGKLDEFERS